MAMWSSCTAPMTSETKSGSGFTGRKVKGTIHWVDAKQRRPCGVPLVRAADSWTKRKAKKGHSFLENLNPNSLANRARLRGRQHEGREAA